MRPIIGAMARRSRYRWRTWLRGRAPTSLTEVLPKGERDCGAHEWYRSDETTWRCYHCEPGVTHVSPWSPADTIAIRLAALARRARALEGRSAAEAGGEYREVVRETMALLENVDLVKP